MGQIFISHSRKDKEIRNNFAILFGTTRVKGIFKEIEGFNSRDASGEIENDIRESAAIFILLGPYLNKIHHTRDWVVWESAIARPMRKDIWVFEPYDYLGKINVIIPHVDHYVVYNKSDEFQKLICAIIESYDDAEVLPTTLGGSVGGAALGGAIGAAIDSLLSKGESPPIWGAILGGALGGVLGGVTGATQSDPARNRPLGLPIKCPKCEQSYRIHTNIAEIRCPCCNAILILKSL